MAYTPQIDHRILVERYTMRHLDLHSLDEMRQPSGSVTIVAYPRLQSAGPALAGSAPERVPSSAARASFAAPIHGALVQPDAASTNSPLQLPPVPAVVTWTPQRILASTIVLPLPHKPTAADVRPSLDAPNEALKLDEVSIAPTDRDETNPSIAAGTSSPVVDPRHELPQLPPVTTSNSAQQPTPAAVMSVSELRMKEGTITLPPGNMGESAASPGDRLHGRLENAPDTRKGEAEGNRHGFTSDSNSPTGSAAGAARGNGPLSNSSGNSSTVHIVLPKDGQFGAVVVGSSLDEKYPEAAELWAGRLAYTVYLHVGLARNWILQYSLPRLNDAAASGKMVRVEAPWPYDMTRPTLDAEAIDSDALMVHGFVDRAGRFEALSIAFPREFTQADAVLNALDHWQFRPATQNGEVAKVEVLLIIPAEL